MDWRDSKLGYGTIFLLIAKKIGEGPNASYEFIEAKYDSNFPDYSIKRRKLDKGKYIIYSSVSWTRSDEDIATISLYTDTRITLEENKEIDV